MAHVEAYIDFSEDENIEEGVMQQAQQRAAELLEQVQVSCSGKSHVSRNIASVVEPPERWPEGRDAAERCPGLHHWPAKCWQEQST